MLNLDQPNLSGRGRLIRTVRRDQAAPTPNEESEDYYYDGVRRVLEVVNETPVGSDARREYVWGPGYVDEVICQLDYSGGVGVPPAVYYYLQDANYNVLAVLDYAGSPWLQYVHSPYGRTLVRQCRFEARAACPRPAADIVLAVRRGSRW